VSQPQTAEYSAGSIVESRSRRQSLPQAPGPANSARRASCTFAAGGGYRTGDGPNLGASRRAFNRMVDRREGGSENAGSQQTQAVSFKNVLF
jgi:hypothetical protein